jgi:hypothetical protein
VISIVKGTTVHRTPKRVLVPLPVMPWRTNSIEDRRLVTSILLKPSLESISISMKPSSERPQEDECKLWWLTFGVTMVLFVGYPLFKGIW